MSKQKTPIVLTNYAELTVAILFVLVWFVFAAFAFVWLVVLPTIGLLYVSGFLV